MAAQSRSGYQLTLGSRVLVDLVLARATVQLDPVVDLGGERRKSYAEHGRELSRERGAACECSRRESQLHRSRGARADDRRARLALGQRWTSTDIRVDGVQAKNMLRSGEFGAGPFTLSMEAIREFEVTTAVYDVTQGRQGGGTMRAATRAGTNTWTGSAFTYYRGSDLAASTDFQSRSRAQRQFSAVQWGGSVGGPIVRDRVHVFFALDRWNSNEPLFTGSIQTPAEEVTVGVARDSLTRLVSILSRSTRSIRRALSSADSIDVRWRTRCSGASTGR